jgi:pyruvate/2-oxoglutarate dehydrogenase complex dihydrolipoamide dehydrogenase (E3) component
MAAGVAAVVRFDKSGVLVNNTMQMELPDVYALGDVTGGATLACATTQGGKVTDASLTKGRKERQPNLMLLVTFVPWGCLNALPNNATLAG